MMMMKSLIVVRTVHVAWSLSAPPKAGAWLPVCSESSFGREDAPQQVEVCGRKYVVWRDDDGKFRMMNDACPHRLAPLSQGRVVGGCVECPYHGFQYDGDGKATKIPQGGDASKVKGKGIETRQTGDLVWAYFDDVGETDEREPAVMYPHLVTEEKKIKPKDWYYVRELPYSWDILVENFMDPAHIPFAHNSLQGVRSDGCAIPMETFALNETHVEVTFKDVVRGEPRDGIVSFQRPVRYHFRVTPDEGTSYDTKLEIFCVPVREGRSRIFFKSFLPVPTWLAHAGSNRFLNTDIWLHDAEIDLRSDTSTDPKHQDLNRYRLVTTADAGPDTFRKWWRSSGMADAPRHSFGPALAPPPRISNRRDLIDAWDWHTKDCATCRRTLTKAKRTRYFGAFGAALALSLPPVPRLVGLTLGITVALIADKVISIVRGTTDSAALDRRSIAAMAPDDKLNVRKTIVD